MKITLNGLDGTFRRRWHEDVSVRGNVIRGVVWWTLVVILALSLIDLLTSDVLPSHGFEDTASLDRAMVAGTALAYIGAMVGVIFSGRLAEALRYSLLVWAMTAFLVILTMGKAGPLSLFMPVSAAIIYTASNLLRYSSMPEPSVLRGVSFGILALWALLLPAIGFIDWPLRVVAFLFILFISLGTISMLPAYYNHPNPWIRVLAKVATDPNLSAGGLACALFVLAYFLIFRGTFVGLSPLQSFLADWGAAALTALLAWTIYRYLHREMLKEQSSCELYDIRVRAPMGMGNMAPVVEAMKDFVELGDKEKLVVRMTRILLDAGLNETEAAQAIQGLMRYRDRPPAVWARWLIGDVRSAMERSRCKAISASLDNLESVLAKRNMAIDKRKE